MVSVINLKDRMEEISGKHCAPIDVAHLNDQVIRMSFIDGDFHWHKHKSQDELFYILKGKIKIKIKDKQNIIMSEGEMAVIPKGVEHCPESIEPSWVLLFEPKNLQSKGD